MTNLITLTDHASNLVTIATTSIEEIWNNPIQDVPEAKTRTTEDEGAESVLINLMRIKRTFTIDGYIHAGGDSSDLSGTDSAQDQRTKLRAMVESTRNITVTYDELTGADALSAGIMKLSIKEDPGKNEEETITKYSVKMTIIIGSNVFD